MDELDFISLTHRIRGKLIALARRFNRAAGCGCDAEDLVQDALVTLWQLSEKGYPIRDAEALAVKLTKTRCVEHFRRQHIRYEPIPEQVPAGTDSAASGTETMDMDAIRTFVQKELSDSQRELLMLRNENGMSLDQIAAVTGRPKSSIKVSLSNARRKMMEKWKTIR